MTLLQQGGLLLQLNTDVSCDASQISCRSAVKGRRGAVIRVTGVLRRPKPLPFWLPVTLVPSVIPLPCWPEHRANIDGDDLFIGQMGVWGSGYQMATVEQQVRSASNAIDRNISMITTDPRFLSQNVMQYLRDLVEGLIVWTHLGIRLFRSIIRLSSIGAGHRQGQREIQHPDPISLAAANQHVALHAGRRSFRTPDAQVLRVSASDAQSRQGSSWGSRSFKTSSSSPSIKTRHYGSITRELQHALKGRRGPSRRTGESGTTFIARAVLWRQDLLRSHLCLGAQSDE